MRTLTAAAQLEAVKRDGQHPIRLVSIEWANGVEWYSSEKLNPGEFGLDSINNQLFTTPAPIFSNDGEHVGTVSEYQLQLSDSDGGLRSRVNALGAGIHRMRIGVFHFWRGAGLTWPADRVTLIDGVCTGIEFNCAAQVWTIKVRSWEARHWKEIGVKASRQVFPEMPCDEEGRAIVPLVYGNPCRRVPGVLIDRPGHTWLASPLEWTDTSATIVGNAPARKFPLDTTINVYVGQPGNTEKLTGSFSSSAPSVFNITDRSSWYAQGEANTDTGALVIANGNNSSLHAIALPYEDGSGNELIPGGATADLAGHMVAIKSGSTWYNLMATMWHPTTRYVVVAFKGNLPMSSSGSTFYAWRFSQYPGFLVRWPVGAEMVEGSPWVYAVNSTQSYSVERVEAVRQENQEGRAYTGDVKKQLWFTYDASAYSVNLNNTTYNSAIGREPSDPGITTVAVDPPPHALNMDPGVWVTLKGAIDADSQLPAETPDTVLRHLLRDVTAAQIPAEFVDDQSLVDAQAKLATTGRQLRIAFAVRESQQVWEIAQQVAAQSTCQIDIVDGKVTLTALEQRGTATSSLVDSTDSTVAPGRTHSEQDAEQWPAKAIGRIERFPGDPNPDIVMGVEDAWTTYGPYERKFNWSAFQLGSQGKLVQDFWQKWLLEKHSVESQLRFVDAFEMVPGDMLDCDLSRTGTSQNHVHQVTAGIGEYPTESSSKEWTATPISATYDDQCGIIPVVFHGNPPFGWHGVIGVGETPTGFTISESDCFCQTSQVGSIIFDAWNETNPSNKFDMSCSHYNSETPNTGQNVATHQGSFTTGARVKLYEPGNVTWDYDPDPSTVIDTSKWHLAVYAYAAGSDEIVGITFIGEADSVSCVSQAVTEFDKIEGDNFNLKWKLQRING